MIYKSSFEPDPRQIENKNPEYIEDFKKHLGYKAANDIGNMIVEKIGFTEIKIPQGRTVYEMEFHCFERKEWSCFIKKIKDIYSLCKMTGKDTSQLDLVSSLIEQLDNSIYFNR